ncbi:hypothetical protein P3T73_15885 [Kiritimatiellota bacterium B12222]|nr:hypothetical protein P3T73_15885 [Kiritimatiellota bacterium B12222]
MRAFIVTYFILIMASVSHAEVKLKPATTEEGYLARLLLNESPFPGEAGWVSEADTKSCMLQILYVLDSRINNIPPGYSQSQIAAVRTTDIIDVITVGGEKGQCDGFYRDASGQFTAVPRVEKRINYLLNIANDGAPGKFARLMAYGQGLATAYYEGGITEADRFAGLSLVKSQQVTGRAYSWMTDKDVYSPGGRFVRIPDQHYGSLGGNRFFTLLRKP